MIRNDIVRRCHLMNEAFSRDLKPIAELRAVVSLLRHLSNLVVGSLDGTDADARRMKHPLFQGYIWAVRDLYDSLYRLLKQWPNAEEFLFPDVWYKDVLRPFYLKVYPAVFPDQPIGLPWREIEFLSGNLWCGVPVTKYGSGSLGLRGVPPDAGWVTEGRLRVMESLEALDTWEQYKKEGGNPADLARRLASRQGRRRSLHTALVTVMRRLNRAHRLIYGKCLPTDPKTHRLSEFDCTRHVQDCAQCSSANDSKEMCRTAQDYVNQDCAGRTGCQHEEGLRLPRSFQSSPCSTRRVRCWGGIES